MDLTEAGAFPTLDASGNFQVRFGVYLPGLRSSDGFAVIVRVILATTVSSLASRPVISLCNGRPEQRLTCGPQPSRSRRS